MIGLRSAAGRLSVSFTSSKKAGSEGRLPGHDQEYYGEDSDSDKESSAMKVSDVSDTDDIVLEVDKTLDTMVQCQQDELTSDKLSGLSGIMSKMSDKMYKPGSSINAAKVDEGFQNLYGDVSMLDVRCQDEHKEVVNDNRRALKQSQQVTSFIEGSPQSFSMCRTPEDVIQSLSGDYFKPNFDPIRLVIQEVSSWPRNEEASNELYMQRIEGLGYR